MPGLVAGSRSSYIYQSDDGKSYQVSMSTPKAQAGGFGIGPASGGQKPTSMKVRGVFGAKLGSGLPDSAPATVFLPIASASHALFVGSTITFSVAYPGGTISYQVTGIKGERRYRLRAA